MSGRYLMKDFRNKYKYKEENVSILPENRWRRSRAWIIDPQRDLYISINKILQGISESPQIRWNSSMNSMLKILALKDNFPTIKLILN